MQKTPDVSATGSGIKVKREIIPSGTDSKKAVRGLSVGDRVTVRITVEASRDFDFVQITDRRAACMEPVNRLSGYRNGAYISPKDKLLYRHASERNMGDRGCILHRPCGYIRDRNMCRSLRICAGVSCNGEIADGKREVSNIWIWK